MIAPGYAAFLALRGRGCPGIVGVAIGWALGYVLEILAFNLTAALDARFLFLLYPPSRSRPRSPGSSGTARGPRSSIGRRLKSPRTTWLTAALCTLAIIYVAISLFPEARLPGDGSVTYNQDVPWAISQAADLSHHWPLADPNVAGEGLPYHFFASAHMAAAGQVTGIGLPEILLRFFPLSLAACVTLQFAAAGRLLFGRTSIGLTAGALAMFVNELQLDLRGSQFGHVPFVGVSFTLLLSSPSFLFGTVPLIPLIALLGERLGSRGAPAPAGTWALVALFMVGVSDAKVTILPLVIVALGGFAAWMVRREGDSRSKPLGRSPGRC